MTDCLLTQADLDVIYIWSVENQLPLSLPQCVCQHYGFNNNNIRHKYVINGVMQQEVTAAQIRAL